MEILGYILLFVGSALTTYFIMRIHGEMQMAKYIDRTSLALAGEILIAKRAQRSASKAWLDERKEADRKKSLRVDI